MVVSYMSEDENVLNFKYKFSEDYNPHYVNGAYGGISPTGEIVVNFYFERTPVPYEEKVQTEDGETVEVKPKNHEENMIRFVPTGVVMNLESAKSIHDWLGEHIEFLERKS